MKTILIADDEDYNLDLMSRNLEGHGFEVLTATEGRTAVAWAKDKRPDLILLDITFENDPDFTGFNALHEIRGCDETRNIPLIALTGDSMSDTMERVLTAGFDDFETKPINYDRLVQKMRTMLGTA